MLNGHENRKGAFWPCVTGIRGRRKFIVGIQSNSKVTFRLFSFPVRLATFQACCLRHHLMLDVVFLPRPSSGGKSKSGAFIHIY